jgi:hypothetical protein
VLACRKRLGYGIWIRQAKAMRTTYMAKDKEIERKWYVIDATGIPLGRLASEVARILRLKW